MLRSNLLAALTQIINAFDCPHPLRVAVDGIDASGKTILANELAVSLRGIRRTVIRASLDSFHNPRSVRYRHSPDSPQGCYADSYDYPNLQASLLQPLGPDGSWRYRTAIFDYQTDQPVDSPWMTANPRDILLFDGIFLLRPELIAAWDFSIFLDISFETALQRALLRDVSLFGSSQIVLDRYQRRYFPAQQYYLQTCCPAALADTVIDNNDPHHPIVVRSRFNLT